MTIKNILDKSTKLLKNSSQRPRLESEILLSYFLNKDRVSLIINEDLDIENYKEFFFLVDRRVKEEPIEYITNKVSFYSENFFVQSGVLIPRPETELLIDEVLKKISKEDVYNIAEIGIGSGIISIMLSKFLPNSNFFGTDILDKPLETTAINIKNHDIKNIKLIKSNLLDNVSENIDIIVTNPPYIENNFKIDKNLEYEPKQALFGGEVGDELIKKIIDLCFTRNIKILFCEMGYDQKDKIEYYMQDKKYKNLSFYKDLNKLDRGFILEL
jgi:release factor glutamine methyltransferase